MLRASRNGDGLSEASLRNTRSKLPSREGRALICRANALLNGGCKCGLRDELLSKAEKRVKHH